MVFDVCGHMCVCSTCLAITKKGKKCYMCNTMNYNAFIAEGGEDEDEDGDSL
jgi:hypothetical protein